MKNISRTAEERIDATVKTWACGIWDVIDPAMIESLKKIMREEFCHGFIEGHNIATAKATRKMKQDGSVIPEEKDAVEVRR